MPQVIVVIGAGQIGQAIARRAGKQHWFISSTSRSDVQTFAVTGMLCLILRSLPGDKMSRNLLAIVFLLVPASTVTLASDFVGPRLPTTCETAEIVALRSAAFRGPTAPGIAEDQFHLAVAIEQAARECPTGKEDGLYEAHG
jgi:prephenate dehydrogenase